MKLSKNSWHVKVYELTFNNSRLPPNLCPYFWKVISALIVMLTLGWFYLPAALLEKTVNAIKKEKEMDFISEGFFSEFFGIAFVANLGIYLLLSTVFVWRNFSNKLWQVGFVIFCSAIIITIIVLIVEKRKRTIEGRPKKPYVHKPYEEPEPSIFVEFIKAKYKKYCPKIDWKENPPS